MNKKEAGPIKNTPKKPRPTASTQSYLDIDEVKDGVVVLKDGSIRAVIYVSSMNFDLKSEAERQAILGSFQGFLNSLNFPIQISTNSRRLDLKDYIDLLEKQLAVQENRLLKIQIQEYINFISGLLSEINIMEKMFFVIVPFYPNALEKNSVFGSLLGGSNKKGSTNFENDKNQLMDRVDVVVSGLKSVGLNCASLDTNGLIQLYYTIYNPESMQIQKSINPEDIETQVVQFGKKKERDAEHMEI